MNPENILGSFSDLTELSENCPRGCSHLSDAPDCSLNEALADGILGSNGAQRIDSLQRLLLTFKAI